MADNTRKYNPSEINLKVESMQAFQNDNGSGLVIEWSSKIGFGEYTLFKPCGSDKWYADGGADEKLDRERGIERKCIHGKTE